MANPLREMVKKIPGAKTVHRRRTPKRPPALDVESINQQLQVGLLANYRSQFRRGDRPFDDIRDAGFRCHSQFEEDGILLYILAGIGMKTRRVVEIGCGTGAENMSTNLILNHGFEGYLFDGSASNIQAAGTFYRSKKDCLLTQPNLTQAWITRENVNETLQYAGAEGEVDVFSLDVDGNDWYVWNAIEAVNPRVCVFETHNIVPGQLALTIPYQSDFDYMAQPENQWDFRSASLGAMIKLSSKKGYRLIGAHRHGFNAFFLRNDLAPDLFPQVSIEQVHDNPWTREGQKNRWPIVSGLGWVEV
jgi:hypothetical protein